MADIIQMRSLNGDELYPITIMSNVIGLNETLEIMNNYLTNKDRFESFVVDLIKNNIVSANIGNNDGLNIINDDGQFIMMTKQFNS